jgi:hypothetical protein
MGDSTEGIIAAFLGFGKNSLLVLSHAVAASPRGHVKPGFCLFGASHLSGLDLTVAAGRNNATEKPGFYSALRGPLAKFPCY